MTKSELLDAIKDCPNDMEILIESEGITDDYIYWTLNTVSIQQFVPYEENDDRYVTDADGDALIEDNCRECILLSIV